MAKYKIAWLPGDGVGNDVMEAAGIILDKIGLDAEYIHGDIGWEFWKTEANPLPDRTVDLLKNTDCALFGAITSLPKEEAENALIPELKGKGHIYSSPIVRLRQEFNLRTNLRPCKAYPGNPLNYKDGIDIIVFRENTEDLYSGVEFFPLPDEVRETIKKHNKKMARFDGTPGNQIAVSLRINTKNGCKNIITDAFEYAKKFNRKSVTVVEKPNVIRETSGLMVRTAREVAKNYPGIELWETNIDAMCMWLIKNPLDYSVLVTSNMFGDIVSDLCAQLVGGLGFAASGNIGDNYAVFEPTHGSAPKYAGQYKVNPMAMLLSVKMMFDYLNEADKAAALDRAITKVVKEGKVRTYDMGGKNTSLEVAQEVARNI
ncbi:MAG: isocitrate/isopropylmalate dehydrogenase family protein [candidate division Zixibacteria bacterium]|nr:isocitrate/isopropylmalate dehydrogenase family protein [candidate division Zixibacteria bacterium]